MIKKAVQKLLTYLNDRSLQPASRREEELIDEFRLLFGKLPLPELVSDQPSEKKWFLNMTRLRELVLTGNPREFLRWDVIKKTMFVAYASYIDVELDYLKKNTSWDRQWCDAINESIAGHPLPYPFYPRSSGNRAIHGELCE